MTLETLQKEAREELNRAVAHGKPNYKNLLDTTSDSLIRQAYLQGIRDAKGCVVDEKEGKEISKAFTRDDYQEELWSEGYGYAVNETLEAITRLEDGTEGREVCHCVEPKDSRNGYCLKCGNWEKDSLKDPQG